MADLDSTLEYDEIMLKVFANEEEGFQFYNSYASKKGFSVRRSYCEWVNDKSEMTLRRFVCSCEGYREAKHLDRENKKRKSRNITRCGCKAALEIARDQNSGQWSVKHFFDAHSHPMAQPDLVFLLRSHRRINDDQKADIVEMKISGIRQYQIMDIMERLYGGHDKVGFTVRDLYNFCHRNKITTIASGDAQTVLSYMEECKRRDPDFFYVHKTDEKGHLNGLLWCDSQSILDYAAFSDCVVFDSTYKTNRYNMPLVPFVGVNHHDSTVLFACGIISHETIESFVWLLRAFSDAMAQKHPRSVITDGDLAMQRAIKLVWPNTWHRLCTWHIDQNIVRNVHDESVRMQMKEFLQDCWPIEECERKWLEFLDKYNVKETESWLYQMYQMRELWCASYQVGKSFLGLKSNQRSESLHSRIQSNLDKKMLLLELVQHFDHCLNRLRKKEAALDFQASNSEPCLDPDAGILEKVAAKTFTPTVFATVQFSIKTAKTCFLLEVLDAYDTLTYIVGRYNKGDKEWHVHCEISVDDGNLKGISCSCQKLQTFGTPCSHIFFVLEHRDLRELPRCCVFKRWTRCAKSAFPPKRKSTMYDYSDGLQRYRELRNVSHTASLVASRSPEAYERLKCVLDAEAATILPSGGEIGGNSYCPVLPQVQEIGFAESTNVLDPLQVPGRGAPKKKLKTVSNKKRSKVKCTLCKGEGHNRRTCPMRNEETILPEDVLDM